MRRRVQGEPRQQGSAFVADCGPSEDLWKVGALSQGKHPHVPRSASSSRPQVKHFAGTFLITCGDRDLPLFLPGIFLKALERL